MICTSGVELVLITLGVYGCVSMLSFWGGGGKISCELDVYHVFPV